AARLYLRPYRARNRPGGSTNRIPQVTRSVSKPPSDALGLGDRSARGLHYRIASRRAVHFWSRFAVGALSTPGRQVARPRRHDGAGDLLPYARGLRRRSVPAARTDEGGAFATLPRQERKHRYRPGRAA